MTAERYRRLPGRRRGILGGASVWLGSDHLLAVRSMRLRENYKRFYLRDVQAIAVARKPRFHISMRALAVGLPMLWTYLILRSQWDWADVAFWSLAALLTAVWVLVSAVFSCTCRIYTAVSRDELPSVYRTWTARRFLAKVEPLITSAQGVLEGDWTEIAEPKGVGPAPVAPVPVESGDATQPARGAAAFDPAPALQIDNTAAHIFIATLFLDAGFNFVMLRSESRAVFWSLWGLVLARIVTAIVIVVQRVRKRERPGMQKLAIVSLVAMGMVYYIQQVAGQLGAAAKNGAFNPFSIAQRWPVLTQVDAAISVVLGLAGLAIVLRSDS